MVNKILTNIKFLLETLIYDFFIYLGYLTYIINILIISYEIVTQKQKFFNKYNKLLEKNVKSIYNIKVE